MVSCSEGWFGLTPFAQFALSHFLCNLSSQLVEDIAQFHFICAVTSFTKFQ